MTKLRPQCDECPWRDMEWMRGQQGDVVARAATHPDGFVCHVRAGRCDGPRHSGVAT